MLVASRSYRTKVKGMILGLLKNVCTSNTTTTASLEMYLQAWAESPDTDCEIRPLTTFEVALPVGHAYYPCKCFAA